MAKKSEGVNKSEAIREYKESNPKAKPKQIAEALSAQGMEISTAFISTVLSNARRKKTRRGPGRPPKSAKPAAATAKRPARAAASSNEVSIDSLIKVKKIVDEMGSVDEAKAALEALSKLMK